jgi:hypothetical protein
MPVFKAKGGPSLQAGDFRYWNRYLSENEMIRMSNVTSNATICGASALRRVPAPNDRKKSFWRF